jgi:RNA polymerase sigma factor (sigma-70 family)
MLMETQPGTPTRGGGLMKDEEFRDYVAGNYDRLLRFVRGYVLRPQEAEDILQEALLGLWRRRDKIDAAAPGGYFFRSLHNAVVSTWRSQGRVSRVPLVEEGIPDPRTHQTSSDPPKAASQADPLAAALAECADDRRGVSAAAVAAVERACTETFRRIRARMTEPQRQVFAAYLQSDGHQSEAVALLELPTPSTYSNALHRAKNQIRKVLAPHREALLHIIGARGLRELLSAVFCDSSAGPLNEDEP